MVKLNDDVYNIAVQSSKKAWPTKEGCDLELATRWIFHQVAVAMHHLHDEMHIVHRDLKH